MRIRFAAALMIFLVGCALSACSSSSNSAGRSGPSTSSMRPGPASELRTPTVSLPVAAGKGIEAIGTDYNLKSVGYRRDEYFVAGDAVGYKPIGELTRDGKWRVGETGKAPYKTRIVVIKPTNPSRFSGTVFVEWFNVTGGLDAGPGWIMGHNEILRSGAAWVGVTAQAVGVNGSKETVQSSLVKIPKGGLVHADPARYGSLHHPGDLYSYDIYTQAGSAVRGDGKGANPFAGYDVQRVIATGESQSAFRLTTYVDAIQPLTREFDGFLIHSRGSEAAPFGTQSVNVNDPSAPRGTPPGTLIRSDINVPVFTFENEFDVDLLGYADAEQPDSKYFRLWELAGTSHIDSYSGIPALTDVLGNGAAELQVLDPKSASSGALGCDTPVNAGAQYAVLESAMAHLVDWVRDGTPPPQFPRLETTGHGDNIEAIRDAHGIARGGVRTPIVDVPLAANIGDANSGTPFCRVFGHSKPFDAATLAQLYPGGHAEYVAKFDKAADAAVKAGVWLQPEADHFKAAARKISFG